MAKNIGDWEKSQKAAPRNDARLVIENLLQPGETLLWCANGRGPHWISQNIRNALFVGAFIGFFGYLLPQAVTSGKNGPWVLGFALILFSAVSLIMVLAVFYAIVSPSHDCYALTDQRVIVVRRFWFPRIRSYAATSIQNLRVRGGPTGDIGFWKHNPRYVNRAWEIVGVDSPMELAAQIKATLGLTLPIEDVDVGPHIPPLEPRQP